MQSFYWLTGFSHDPKRFFSYWLFVQLIVMFCTFMSHALAIVCATEEVVQLVATTCLPLLGMFAGFLLPPTSIPKGWIFMYYITPMHYDLEVSVYARFDRLIGWLG